MTTRVATVEIVTQATIVFAVVKIISVAGSAGTSILVRGITDVLVITCVTAFTSNVTVMIARVIAVARMIVIIGWYPPIG